jgi:hypothetical protein
MKKNILNFLNKSLTKIFSFLIIYFQLICSLVISIFYEKNNSTESKLGFNSSKRNYLKLNYQNPILNLLFRQLFIRYHFNKGDFHKDQFYIDFVEIQPTRLSTKGIM